MSYVPFDADKAVDMRNRLLQWLEDAGIAWAPVDVALCIELPSALVAECTVQHTSVLLQHDLDEGFAHVRATAVLGDLPPEGDEALMLRMLKANFLAALRGHDQVLGLRDTDDAVCVTQALALHESARDAFRLGLFHLASLSTRWCDGTYLAGNHR